MPRPASVSADDLIEVIRRRAAEGRPVVTTSEIAADLDISVGTVHNHIEDALETGEIETATIGGNSDVFWPVEGREPDHTPSIVSLTSHPDFSGFWGVGWERRGHWQGARKLLRTDIAEGSSPEHRALFLAEIFRTANTAGRPAREEMAALSPGDHGDMETSKTQEEIFELGVPALSTTEMEYYLTEKPLFSVPEYGSVVGLAEFCIDYQSAAADGLYQTTTLGEMANEDIEAWVPDCEALLDAGDTLDELLRDAFQWWW